MTVSEFREQMEWWAELKEFCSDHGICECDDIYDDEGRDSYIENEIDYYMRYESWRALSDYLDGMDQSNHDWWEYYDGEWYNADNETTFNEYLDRVEQAALEDGIITPDEEDGEEEYIEPEPAEEEPEDEFVFEEEDLDICEVFAESADGIAEEMARLEEQRQTEQEANQIFIEDIEFPEEDAVVEGADTSEPEEEDFDLEDLSEILDFDAA